MILTATTWPEKVEELFDSIRTVAEGVTDIESIIGLVVLVTGIIAACCQTFISVCTILSSYNIEIALMTKKERVKVNATSIAIYIIALWFLNLWFCYGGASYTNESLKFVGMMVMFVSAVVLLCMAVLLLGIGVVRNLSNIHICRFLGTIAKKILSVIGTGIYKVVAGGRSICIKLMDKIKDWRILVFIRKRYVICRDWIAQVWKSCERDSYKGTFHKLSFTQQLRLVGFLATNVFGIAFNYEMAIHVKGEYVYLLSTMLTILLTEVGVSFLNFRVSPHDSKIYYHDDMWGKNIFIYFRQDENHCIGGDKEFLGDCNELFLVPYEKIANQKLYSISKWKQDKTNIDDKRIRLQHGQNELMLNEVYDKVNEELKNHGIAPELVETADFYIRPDIRKAYYVLGDGTRGDIDL